MTDLSPPSGAEPPRVVRIGGLTRAELQVRLEGRGVRLNDYARSLFLDDRFSTAPFLKEVEVVVLALAEIGLPDGGTYAQVLQRAQVRGLGTATLELAAQLRLQWIDQPEFQNADEQAKQRAPAGAVTVASIPPPDEQEIPWGFYLRRAGGEPWLRGYVSWSGHLWSGSDRFAFVRVSGAAQALAQEGTAYRRPPGP